MRAANEKLQINKLGPMFLNKWSCQGRDHFIISIGLMYAILTEIQMAVTAILYMYR